MSADSPTERIHEDILDRAREIPEKWINRAAATAAALAALAAISGAISNHYLTMSGRQQLKANDNWSQYQAKSIKANVLRSKISMLEALNKPAPPEDSNKIHEYEKDLDQIRDEAKHRELESELNLSRHEILERGVTLFHIGIAVVAIAVLTRRPSFWYVSMIAGLVGVVFLVQAFWLQIE